ncbi:hypothetical protein Y047_5213 [Burkholderia pseudomallei MSHR3016]|nr:hypothetical protein Y047_5213 [Burkholderia pseudomallei MSHR3016]
MKAPGQSHGSILCGLTSISKRRLFNWHGGKHPETALSCPFQLICGNLRRWQRLLAVESWLPIFTRTEHDTFVNTLLANLGWTSTRRVV